MIFLHLYFALLSCAGLFEGTAGQVYTLTFDPDYSPKATIPTDYKARDYSIALGAITSKQLKAYLREDGNITETGALATAMFDLQSLDENVKTDPDYNDTWLDTGGGEFCQWGSRGDLPTYMLRKYFKYACGALAFQSRFGDHGGMVVDGLVHRHSNNIPPPNKRFYRITVYFPWGGNITADSELFEITAPAKYLSITSAPPATVVANSDFSMAVAIYGYDDQVLTVGTDSVLFAELQVAREKETHVFFDQLEKEDLLFSNTVRLSSPEAQVKSATFNTVVRKRLVNGRATFNNLRLLDVYDGVKLNVTVYQASFPWQRRPDVYSDFDSKVVFVDYGVSLYYMNTSYPQDPAVVLTDPINVTPQKARKIQLLSNPHGKQCANCPIQPLLEVQLLDSNNELVLSGPDAQLTITCDTAGGGELSLDSDFTTMKGRGTFRGSISKIASNVFIKFKANSIIDGNALADASTSRMDVTGELHFGNFVNMMYSGGGSMIGPHIDAWVRFARDDINNDRYNLLPGRTIVTHSYDTRDDVGTTIAQYKGMIAMGKSDPSKRVLGVIGFGGNVLTEKLQPWLTDDKMPQIGTRENKYEFGNKVTYPYYSRLCWDMGAMSQSIMLAVQSRKWTKTVLLKDMTVEISSVFYAKAQAFGIDINEIIIPNLTPEQYALPGVFSEELKKLKQSGTKIVWVFVTAPLVVKLIREAIIAELTPMHGYQWIAVGSLAWHLPYGNEHELCTMEPICTVALRGLNSFDANYHMTMRGPEWENILTHHFKKDLMDYHGGIALFLYPQLVQMGLGYDALRVYAVAADYLINNKLTLTTENLVNQIRQATFEGFTGVIRFDAAGNRPGYYGFLSIIDPHPPQLGTGIAGVSIIPRTLKLESKDSTSQVEMAVSAQWPLNLPPFNLIVNPYALPNTQYFNKRRFNSSTGIIDSWKGLVPIPPDTTPPVYYMREEKVPAPYYCLAGCGGRQFDEFDINKYDQGDCIRMDECLCHDGYFGDTCAEKICQCKNGYCDIPRICICDPGWTGTLCQTAICSDPCENGKCTSPDVCTCDTGYVGGACGYSVAVAVVLPVLFITGLLVGAFFFVRWFLKRHSLQQALANLDWRVCWEEEVQSGVGAVSMVSTANEELFVGSNFISWKSQKCYAQKFNCATLDINNSEVRLEMVHLKELRHNNLVHFVGACLEFPNVALLTEICPKGSLQDVLANDNVKLGWDFKYSLLKDICRGMAHLHHSVFISHGRLKSSNCLVDNRWTCKIAGFGAPVLRYDGPRKQTTEQEETSSKRELFWTAPELLHHQTLDAVKTGTQAGDVFSFSIIMSEVITREEPYSAELMLMTPEDAIALAQDKNHPDAAIAKRKWYESGGDTTKLFRPNVPDSCMPEEYAAKSGLKKLLEQDWSDDPTERLSFRQNLERLNTIYPVKGELIDNLVNMLEKYSSNLEGIVSERTKELQIEKAKTEQLISQMLPKQVMEDLKHGKPVKPESFECVTIFFSDLVGFTAIAKESTPLQVVDLLNDLYTTFDAILDHYDVYKVETIGDAYMVVSGLPIRNGDLHAGEIASVSLDLLSSVCDFKIRHLPETTLQLRIGMHSGPAVAGVVGLKMPRYCLFGDTVNTASRMESISMALRIHMSEHTAKILEKLGGYHLDCRGEREVKGKGTMTTYWLQGKDGFTKPLPGLNLALSASKHEFK